MCHRVLCYVGLCVSTHMRLSVSNDSKRTRAHIHPLTIQRHSFMYINIEEGKNYFHSLRHVSTCVFNLN